MSESSDKGRQLETDVAKLIRKKLGTKVARDSRSGAGTNKSDISDWYRELPLFIEAKNQKNVNIKEWFRQADKGASVGQTPTVAFMCDDELLACLRLSDLLNFLAEIKDLHIINDDFRKPGLSTTSVGNIEVIAEERGEISLKSHQYLCREGHIADDYGYCQTKKCKFSRGYRASK